MAKVVNGSGFTLLELIVFIVVAGIFIPMAYIAFMAVTRASMNPEGIVLARFLAETKMEDLTGMTYSSITTPQESYIDVTSDPRFGSPPMPSPNPYAGYRWRWTIQLVAYQGRTSHGSPTIAIPETWHASTVYRVGDYITPPVTSPTIHFYRCIPRDRWRANTSFAVNSYVSPIVPNNLSYRATARSSFPSWQANRPYVLGDYVIPTAPNGRFYRCTGAGTSGSVEPSPWPLTGVVADGTVTWLENTNTLTTGPQEPVWPEQSESTPSVDDGNITWIKEQMHSASTEPSWPNTGSATVNDGSLRWQESTPYKLITVCVREPKGFEYVVNSLVTARPGAYP